jgi:hypothetical protein
MPNARRRLDWFKLYPADFFGSHNVIMMSHAERGAYILLLMRAWSEKDCGLPNDDTLLARLLGMSLDEWNQIAPVVKENFRVRNDRLYNQRLLDERKLAMTAAEKIRSVRQSHSPFPPDPPSQTGEGDRDADADRDRDIDADNTNRPAYQTQISDLQSRPANAGANAKPLSSELSSDLRLLFELATKWNRNPARITEQQKKQLSDLIQERIVGDADARQEKGRIFCGAWKKFLEDDTAWKKETAGTIWPVPVFIKNYDSYVIMSKGDAR